MPTPAGRDGAEVTAGNAAMHQDLAVVGTLAGALTPDDLGGSLEVAVELLRNAVGADDCEIFLGEPEGSDLLLAACSGPDRRELMERPRFEVGVGYPGIVATTGEPLLTHALDRDRRFLRRRLTERGIHSFVCVPLPGPHGPLGCLSLAWRDPEAPIEQAADLAGRAARPISVTVRAGFLAAREIVDRAIEEAGTGADARRRAFLEVLVRTSGARAGTLLLYDPQGGETSVLSTSLQLTACPEAADGRSRCPALMRGHGIVLEPARDTWPDACRRLPAETRAPCCLPLRSNKRLQGMVALDLGSPPSPPGRDLVTLLSMAGEGAARLLTTDERPSTATGGVTPVLEVRCFGRFDVRLHEQPVPPEAFTRRKALSLLKMLVLSAGNPISRDALVERLWPGVDGRVGANRLHGVLHALRSAIEPFREQRRWIYVCNIGELYYFNMEAPHWIDVYGFRRQAASATEAERRGRTEEAIRHLESALALYRGDLFEDEPYSDWCQLERAELRHRYVDLTKHVADLWLRTGAGERAVEWLRRGLLADPLREDLHQALIGGLVALARRQEALTQYRACVRLLREELGADPLPQTRQLGRLAGEPGAQPRLSPS